MPSPKRDHLVETAERLFAQEGFKGVSVDRVLEESGVAKMTLYKAFAGKDALIQETLRRRAARLEACIEEHVARAGENPVDRLLACFDAMEAWSERPAFNGCYFVGALAEYGAEDCEEARLSRAYKAAFLDRLATLCAACDLDDPDDMARTLFMLIDGATAARLTLGDAGSYARAKRVARGLLRAAG